ncbi:MAG: Gfo/Idh/MocA family oxidoreductase [Chitinophagaceae bacterium]
MAAASKILNWGIIGCGDVTEIKSGPGFQKADRSALVAVMRRDAAKAADYAQRHGVPKWYSDADELLNDAEVDAIYIATPPGSHESYTIKALSMGKPVYVEKPMALNMASCVRMANAAKQFDTKLVVAHYRRAVPMFVAIKEWLECGALGDIRTVQLTMLMAPNVEGVAKTETNWRTNPKLSGGGYFHDLAPHQLDLMLHWFGVPEIINGFGVNQSGLYTADDAVAGQLLFSNNIVFSGTWCFGVGPGTVKDWCQITGSKGSIGFPFFGKEIIVNVEGNEARFPFEHPAHIQQPMIEKVTAYFLGDGGNPCPAVEGVEVMRMMDVFTAGEPV